MDLNIATATPPEVDAEIKRLTGVYTAVNQLTDRTQIRINRAAGDRPDRKGHYSMSAADARAMVEEISRTRNGPDNDWEAKEARKLLDALYASIKDGAILQNQIAKLEAEWAKRGYWTRAFLAVTNGRGHIHASQMCSTCNNGERLTEFYWFTELSGADEAEIIKQAGSDACTVCYPNAPVDDLKRPSSLFTPDEEAREANRVAKIAKRAAKDAKAITNPDGTALRGPWGIINTERSAEIEAVKALADDEAYEFEHPSRGEWLAYVELAIEALAAKRGVPAAEVRTLIETKAAAKIKRDKVEAEKWAKQRGL
jgi:hypothetical protein